MQADSVFLGSTPVDRILLGDSQVWEKAGSSTGMWVMVGTHKTDPVPAAMVSADGISWESIGDPTQNLSFVSLSTIATDGAGHWVTSGTAGAFETTGNPSVVPWTSISSLSPGSAPTAAIAYGQGSWVGDGPVDYGVPVRVAIRAGDGRWDLTQVASESGYVSDIAYGGSKFVVAVVSSGATPGLYWCASTDLGSWTPAVQPLNASAAKVVYNEGSASFIALHNGFSQTRRSSDGITWAAGTNAPSVGASIAAGNSEEWMWIGTGGAIRYSSNDGVFWVPKTPPAGVVYHTVRYANGRWVFIGNTAAGYCDSADPAVTASPTDISTIIQPSAIAFG